MANNEYTVWKCIACPKLEIKDTFVSEKVITILRPFILSDDIVYRLKDIFRNEISLGLSNSEESSLPMTVTFITEHFTECEGDYVAICVHFNLVTLTLVRLKSGVPPAVQKKSYTTVTNFFEKPYLKIYEEIAEFVKVFFYEFQLDGKTVPTGFCTDMPMKQLNLDTAIIHFNKGHPQLNKKDVKTYFDSILCNKAYQKSPIPLHSPSDSTPKVGENSAKTQSAIYDAKFLGCKDICGIETDYELCHKTLAKLQVDIERPLQDVILEMSNAEIKVQLKGSKDILYQHPLNEIKYVTQDYADSTCFGYVFGNCTKGYNFFGFKTECKNAEILLVLKNTFKQQLTRKMEEELNMKASQVFIELKDFLPLVYKLTAKETEIPITLEKRVKLVENICWWLEGCTDDVMPTLMQHEETDLSVKIQELYFTAIEMKLAEIEEKEEIQRKIAKANKKHLRKKKEIEYKRPDDTKRKKSSLHPYQLKVSHIIKEHVVYFRTIVKNRKQKTEILKEQIFKVEDIDFEDDLVEEASHWLKSYCIESCEEMKKEIDILKEKGEFLISLENSERKNVQVKVSDVNIGQQQHLNTIQKKPDQPIFQTFDFKIPDRTKEKSEVLQKIWLSKRNLLASIKVRREEIEQLNCFISELFLKSDKIHYEESSAVKTSRKILVKAVKILLKEIKYIETALSHIHTLEENLIYVVPNVLQFFKSLYENMLRIQEVKISQFQDIISRILDASNISILNFELCKEVYYDVRNVVEADINGIEKIISKFQAEENALDLNVFSVCSRIYSEIIERRKQEFDELLRNLDVLDKVQMDDLDDLDDKFTSNLKEIFLASIVIREKEIEMLENEMHHHEGSVRKDSKVIVRMKDLFLSALELEKRYYEKILFKKTEDKVLPIIYPLNDLFDVIAKQLKNEQLKESTKSVSDKKIQVHTTLEEFLSKAFELKQMECEIPLNELKQDLEKVLLNMINQVKEKEDQRTLEHNRHYKAMKISNSWKEMFLIAIELRRNELIQVIPAKIKDLKEEQANIETMQNEELSNANNEGKEIASFWRSIFSDVLKMKRQEIKRIMHLIEDSKNFSLEEETNSTSSLDKKSYQDDNLAEILEKLNMESKDIDSKISTSLNKSKHALETSCINSTQFETDNLVGDKSFNSIKSNVSSETSLAHPKDKQKSEKEHLKKWIKYKEHLKSLEHKRLKQPTYAISNWNDIIVQAFLIQKLETAQITTGENFYKVIGQGMNTKSKSRNGAFHHEFTWDELLQEASKLTIEETKLSHLLQTKKEINIPLLQWSNIFNKAAYLLNDQINKECTEKQNENILLQWKTKIDSKEYSDFFTACNYDKEAFTVVKSEDSLFGESSTFDLSKSVDLSSDLKQLKETLSAKVAKESLPTETAKEISNGILWNDIFQDFATVIEDSNIVVNILKKQDLKTQYQAARIYSSWNDYFMKTFELKKADLQRTVQERTMRKSISKIIYDKVIEESQDTLPPLLNEKSQSWTDKFIEVLNKHQNDLLDAVSIKESEMNKEKASSQIEFEKKMEENMLLNTDPKILAARAKQMFTVALNLQRAKVKAMENELKEIEDSKASQEELVTERYSETSEQLFCAASKSLKNKLDNGESKTKEKNLNVGPLDKPSKLPSWEMLFQTTFEMVMTSIEKMEKFGQNEAVIQKDYAETVDNYRDSIHWADTFIDAVEQMSKEMNPGQIDLNALLEQEISNRSLPSWNEIFFVMSNYSKHVIQRKLNSHEDASCTIAAKDDLLKIKLLDAHNLFSWDNMLITVIEEFLKEIENTSNQLKFKDSSYLTKKIDLHPPPKKENNLQPGYFFDEAFNVQKEEYSWINLFPTNNGAKRYEAEDNLLVTKTKLLYPNSVYKHKKIPDDIMWKHLFPLAVLVWRKKMSSYLNFNKDFLLSNEHERHEAGIEMEIANNLRQKCYSSIMDISNLKAEDIQKLKPEYFSISVSWREIFLAAVERKRKILCKLLNLKKSKSGRLDNEALSKDVEFSANKVLDLPISPGELVKAYKVSESKGLVIYNQRSDKLNKQVSENKISPAEDIESCTVIGELRKILSTGMDLRMFELSILQQELKKIENYSKENKMASNSLKTIRKYYCGAKGYRQNENKKIDNELESIKDVKEVLSEYVCSNKDDSIYQRNKQQSHYIKKTLQNLQEIQRDFEQKLTVHLNQCISDCKILIEKRSDPHRQIDLNTIDMLLEKPKLKGINLLTDSKSVLKNFTGLQKEELENFEKELELMNKKDNREDFLENKVFNIFCSISTLLFDALNQRNHLVEILTYFIDNTKSIICNMDTKMNTAFACCKDFFSKAIQKRKLEITTLNLEINSLESNLNSDLQKVCDTLSSCKQYVENATSKRNQEIQMLDSYLEQLLSTQVSDCHSTCLKYFSTASEKRKQEILQIQALMEPLINMEKDQEKDSELSSALDEALHNVFGVESNATTPEIEKSKTDETKLDAEILKRFSAFYSNLLCYTQNEVKEIEENLRVLDTFKDAIEEEPIQLLRNFTKILKNDVEIIKTEIDALHSEIKTFKTNQDMFKSRVNNVLSICHKYLTESLENVTKEIEELSFRLKILSGVANENDERNSITMSSDLQYTEAKHTYFAGLGLESETDDTQQLLSESCSENAIEILQAAMKWRNVFIKTLTDDIKFLLNSNNRSLQILNSCKEMYYRIQDKRKEELVKIIKVLDTQVNKKDIEITCEDCLKEVNYLNINALNTIEDELVRLAHIVKLLYKEKKDIFNLCEQVIVNVICKKEEEIKAMASDLSHLQIMASAEETELLSHCKSCLQNGIEERENQVNVMKSDLKQWSLETEILPTVSFCAKHLISCLEKNETEFQYIHKLLKSLKEEGTMSILLYSPTLETIVEKNNTDYVWLQPEISKFAYIQNQLELKGEKIVEACHKLYCNALENFKIEIESLLQDIDDLQEISFEKSDTDELKDQEAVVSFNHLFMNAFHLKKLELERDVRRKDIQDDIQRKKMDILGVNNNEVLEDNNVTTYSAPTKTKKKDTTYEITSLTQMDPYFDKLKREKVPEMEAKILEEFKDLEQKLTVIPEFYLKTFPSSEKESVDDYESNSNTEVFTNRVYEIKVKQIEDGINLKRKKIENVILKRKSRMDDLMKIKKLEMEECIVSKERKIRHMVNSIQNKDSQVVCSLKDIFNDVVELKSMEKFSLKDNKQLDFYKDEELEAQNVLVNLYDMFGFALTFKEEEIDMLKQTNFKHIEKKILLMKKESEKIFINSKIQLEEALKDYREHEKARALIYAGVVKTSKVSNLEEYIINDEEIFPNIKAFKDYISTLDAQASRSSYHSISKNEGLGADTSFNMPFIRSHTYALHGVAGHVLKLYSDEVQSLSKVLCDITTEIEFALQHGISFETADLPTNNSVKSEKKEIHPDVVAVLNTNTSMLMLGSFMDSKCNIALNLGYEFGLVYFEQTSKVQTDIFSKPRSKEVSIDVGLKHFTFNHLLDMISTEFDWDVTTVPFYTSRFQKFISDAGLLEQIRFVMVDLHHQHLFCRKCDIENLSCDNGLKFKELSKFLSTKNGTEALQSLPIKCTAPLSNDVNVALYLIKLVLTRGALLTSICLAPLLEGMESQSISIITNSQFIQEISDYQSYIKIFISKLAPGKEIEFLFSNDKSCGMGAALTACVMFELKNHNPENLLFEFQALLKQKSQLFHVNDFIKLLENKTTSEEALKLAYKYLNEIQFNLPISVAWANYFMKEQFDKAEKLFKDSSVSLKKVQFLICQHIHLTGNLQLCKKYIEFIKKHCSNRRLIAKIYRCLFDFLVCRMQYDEAMSFVQDMVNMSISLGNLRYSSLIKLYNFRLKNSSRYENISMFSLPLQETYSSSSDSDLE